MNKKDEFEQKIMSGALQKYTCEIYGIADDSADGFREKHDTWKNKAEEDFANELWNWIQQYKDEAVREALAKLK